MVQIKKDSRRYSVSCCMLCSQAAILYSKYYNPRQKSWDTK